MRYPPQHKLATRRRIVSAASRAFRERGVQGTGVDEVMRRAGLTHGGFYAHFRDKDDLVAEACRAAFVDLAANLDRIGAQPTPARRARTLIDSYLSSHHRDRAGSGCLVVAVAADIARLEGPARAAYAQAFGGHLAALEAALRLDPDPAENRERVLVLLGALVGGMLMARALDERAASDGVLRAVRRQLHRQFCSLP